MRPDASARLVGSVRLALAAAALCLPALGPDACASRAACFGQAFGRAPSHSSAQGVPQTEAREAVVVRWPGAKGVGRYRLQVATDERFEDIVLDLAVEGRQHALSGLKPGTYYWRVAAAAREAGAYSKPERLTVAAGRSDIRESPRVVTPAVTTGASSGWRTATGAVKSLTAGKIRAGGVVDFVGVASDGRVFALDGANGQALWNARAEGQAAAAFAPLLIALKGGGAGVMAAAGGGVRMLRGDTGRELWRARLEGAASGGAVADFDGDGADELIVVTRIPHAVHALASDTGRVLASAELDGEPVGRPLAFIWGGARGLAVALANNTVETRGADLKLTGALKLDARPTTGPLLAGRGREVSLVVGTERGLVAARLPELKTAARVGPADEGAGGPLAGADLGVDGAAGVVTVSAAGRVTLFGAGDGSVRWQAEGAAASAAAALADLNSDGVLDVIVPGAADFVLGFSGRDGALLLRVEESGVGRRAASEGAGAGRWVVAAPAAGGGLMLAGPDETGEGLRAVEVKTGAGAGSGQRG
jgi:outer membrane protein assembly factor BamB